ncbi:MAG: galactokinase [Solirubrobacterales bacterium]|nr:galactokinase [Solirubrobacterales bacterium]MBV9364065.1 galactokinase [Solirubrobacterales bacterium]MBV9680518.1 galactokinase [Solirubrobacterales bacterium]
MPIHASAFGPGRVNLIGEHTDYNDGLALPFAITEGVTVRATAREDRRIEAVASDLGEQDSFDLGGVESADGWRAFVRGAAHELERFGVALSGAELAIAGTLPRGSGLSSSAALEVALVLALLSVSDAAEPDRIELAKLCSRIENDWVGAQTGLLDQIASLCGAADRALLIDFQSLDVQSVALQLGDYRLVTLDSGEEHTHAGSGYNQRRAECAEAASALGVESLREATLRMAERLDEPLSRRARHVITENQRVRDAVDALERGDMDELGRLLDASHASLRDCYEVSTPAVEDAVGRCTQAGAVGARIMGGGFGGSVLALFGPRGVPPDGAVEVRPGPGARVTAE